MKSIAVLKTIITANLLLFVFQQYDSQLVAQCSSCATPENVPISCTPGLGCNYNISSPSEKNCVSNCVSIYKCISIGVIGDSMSYIYGVCSSDGKTCANAVYNGTYHNVYISTALQGSTCIGY